ncbi:MAG: Zn-ribbon domain-containing OB-fold protein [Acidimicrobiales bacterium]
MPSPGRGSLFSWTVTHIPFDPGWAGEVPYTTVVVELDEGVRLLGAIDGVKRADLHLGLPLTASLDSKSEGFVFLTFRP